MKRLISIFSSLLICFCISAQKHASPETHSLLLWANGGTTMTIDQLDWTTAKLGSGGMIGAGYQWQKKLFVLNIGAEISFQHRITSIANTQISQEMYDTEKMPFTYRGYIKDRTDNMNSIDVNIPVLVGIQGKVGYLLGGLKLSINGYTWFKQQAYYSTDGLYDRFYDPLVDMPNHGFHDYEPANTKSSCWIGAELMASAETGVIFPTNKNNTKIRLGLFGDFGIFQYSNRITNCQGPLLQADWTNFLQLTLNNAYLSNEGVKAALHNLNVGIKLTVMWQYNSSYPCLICRWNNGKYN